MGYGFILQISECTLGQQPYCTPEAGFRQGALVFPPLSGSSHPSPTPYFLILDFSVSVPFLYSHEHNRQHHRGERDYESEKQTATSRASNSCFWEVVPFERLFMPNTRDCRHWRLRLTSNYTTLLRLLPLSSYVLRFFDPTGFDHTVSLSHMSSRCP
jgi:hypothetical protein